MRIIAIEEHYTIPAISSRISKEVIAARGWPAAHESSPSTQKANELLPDLGEKRLQSMEEAGISMQVLSVAGPGAELLPLPESLSFAQDYNNSLAKTIQFNKEHYAGFAHLPVAAPEAAAKELERTVKEMGFCGAMINGMTGNVFLDDERFVPLLAKAEELGVPLYLHPSFPPPAVQELYYHGLSPVANSALASAAFGWHAEVAIHVLRLIASGTLDRFPGLQLIIGHMGEMLPFMMYRAEAIMPPEVTGSKRTISETLKSQVYITTSGFFTVPPLMNAIETFGIDRIIFSVDYPFSMNKKGRDFLDKLPLKPEEIEQIAHGNADRLLKLRH